MNSDSHFLILILILNLCIALVCIVVNFTVKCIVYNSIPFHSMYQIIIIPYEYRSYIISFCVLSQIMSFHMPLCHGIVITLLWEATAMLFNAFQNEIADDTFNPFKNLLSWYIDHTYGFFIEQLIMLIPTPSRSASPKNNWHDGIIKWKHFPRYWPFVTGEFPAQKASDAEFWCFLWSAPEKVV